MWVDQLIKAVGGFGWMLRHDITDYDENHTLLSVYFIESFEF